MMEREVQVGTQRWRLNDTGEFLLDRDGLRLRAWLAANSAHPIKVAPHRAVYRLALPEGDFYLKMYHGDRKARWRAWFCRSRAEAEYDILRELRERGVPTLDVIACGHDRATADSYLITRTLPDAHSLSDWLETHFPMLSPRALAQQRQVLARTLGRFLALLHRAGVRHEDLHPGNLLLRWVDNQPHLYLIDVLAVRLSRPLSWASSQANLVMLDRWFALRFSRTDRRRCLRSYIQARPDLGMDESLVADQLHAATDASLLAWTRRHDHRCLGGNRHYRAFALADYAGHVVSDISPDVLTTLVAQADQLLATAPRILKAGHSATVALIQLPTPTGPRTVVFKRFHRATLTEALASLFRPSQALRSYTMGHGFRLRGLPTPRPLAIWHRRWFGMCCEGYLLTEFVPESRDLLTAVRDMLRNDRVGFGELLDETAGLLRRLHQRQIGHRDLKAANLLVSNSDWVIGPRGLCETERKSPRPRVWFIDLVGACRYYRLTFHHRVRNLARLHVSFHAEPGLTRSDRLRFLLRYLGREGIRGVWKSWWREIELLGRRKLERNRRRGRLAD